MQDKYSRDPLTPDERAAYEEGLISFCDRELDLLGDIAGLTVLYAGGSSPLWLEGLSQRIGEGGTLIALESDGTRVQEGRRLLHEADLIAPVHIVRGDVFRPPFPVGTFDLAYSAGLFHELNVRRQGADEALAALASMVRPGGRVATSDFVDAMSAVQLEDEELQRETALETTGAELYGIGSPERLIALHAALLTEMRYQISSPQPVQHLDKIFLTEESPENLRNLPEGACRKLREQYGSLRERVKREGYSRPATLYVEGLVDR